MTAPRTAAESRGGALPLCACGAFTPEYFPQGEARESFIHLGPNTQIKPRRARAGRGGAAWAF